MKANIPVEVMEVLPDQGTPARLNICNKVRHTKDQSSGDDREEGWTAMNGRDMT